MKARLLCLSLAACVFPSCEKSENKAKPDETSSRKTRVETRADTPTIAQRSASARRDAPGTDIRNPGNPPPGHPVTPEMIRPAGSGPDDGPWETLTAEEMIGKFQSNGIARIPGEVSDKILSEASSAGTPDDQVDYIIQQAAAWHRINQFKESADDMPDHMKLALLEKLSAKHDGSWKDMLPELDEQVAASAKVMELRLNGIPGMSPDESQDFLINALEKYGPDYKTILSIAGQSAR